MTKPSIAAIFPTFNEETSIGSVVLCTSQHADRVIVIDDGLTDRTARAEGSEITVRPIRKEPQIHETAICVYLRSSAVNHNHSSFHGGMHMTVTIAALWDQLYFSDTDLHGLAQINGFNNIINIFQLEQSTTNHLTHFPEVLT